MHSFTVFLAPSIFFDAPYNFYQGLIGESQQIMTFCGSSFYLKNTRSHSKA